MNDDYATHLCMNKNTHLICPFFFLVVKTLDMSCLVVYPFHQRQLKTIYVPIMNMIHHVDLIRQLYNHTITLWMVQKKKKKKTYGHH